MNGLRSNKLKARLEDKVKLRLYWLADELRRMGLDALHKYAHDSACLSIFDERGKSLVKIGEGFFAANAHSVAVDSRTHRVYFPLQNVGGKPVLRIALPTDK
jgi:hypothetical protein